MISYGLMRALTETPEVPTIDPSDLTPGALQQFFQSITPSLTKLLFNIIVSIVIFLIGS